MRVLTTTMCYPTPAHPDQGIFVHRRAAALAEMPGVELRVVAPRLWCPLLRRNASEAAQPTGQLHSNGSITAPRMLSAPILGWALDGVSYSYALERAIRDGGLHPDIIDAHFEYPDGVGAWLAGRRLGIPVAVTLRGKIVSLSRRTIRRMQIAAMLREIDLRIAVSASLADWARRVGGSDLHIEVIPNGIDRSVYHPFDRSAARAALGWERHARYVLAVGHFQRLKGFDRVLATVARVRAAVGDVRFVLVGSRRGERGFRRQVLGAVNELNGARVVPPIVLGDPVSAERLNLMYNAADVLVSASRSEGWCNAIAEALAAGTPVVATDVGGNREQLRTRGTGIIVPDGDEAGPLADGLISALNTTWDRDAIAARGSVRTWTHAATEVHAAFTRTLAGCLAPSPRETDARAVDDPAIDESICSPQCDPDVFEPAREPACPALRTHAAAARSG
jgi:teichuronic acid biosynthesis glycosyltransferase TuaC